MLRERFIDNKIGDQFIKGALKIVSLNGPPNQLQRMSIFAYMELVDVQLKIKHIQSDKTKKFKIYYKMAAFNEIN